MTPEELNIACAEARGWKCIYKDEFGLFRGCNPSPKQDRNFKDDEISYSGHHEGTRFSEHVPNLISDANAQRDAFLELSEGRKWQFSIYLQEYAADQGGGA